MRYFVLLALLIFLYGTLCFCATLEEKIGKADRCFGELNAGFGKHDIYPESHSSQQHKRKSTKPSKPFPFFNCFIQSLTSAIGSLFALTLTYPLQTAASRSQLYSMDNPASTTALQGGPLPVLTIDASLFDGYVLTVINQVATEFSFTFFYELLKPMFYTGTGKASDIMLFFTAPFAGSVAAFFQNPLSLIKGRLDALNARRRAIEKDNPNIISEEVNWKQWFNEISEIIVQIYRDEGILSFFTTGLAASCLLTWHPTINNFLYDTMTGLHERRQAREVKLASSQKSPSSLPSSRARTPQLVANRGSKEMHSLIDSNSFSLDPSTVCSHRVAKDWGTSLSDSAKKTTSVDQSETGQSIHFMYKILYCGFSKCIATIATYPVSLLKTQLTARSSAQTPQNVEVVSNYDIFGKVTNTLFKAVSQIWSVLSIVAQEVSKKYYNEGVSALYVGWQYKVFQNVLMAIIQRLFRDMLFAKFKTAIAYLGRTCTRDRLKKKKDTKTE